MALLRLTAVEGFKLRQRAMTWILLAVLLGMIVVVYVLYWAATESLAAPGGQSAVIGDIEIKNISQVRETIYLRQAVPFGLQLTQILGTFLAAILVSGSMGSEYGWNTIRPYMTMVPTRWEFIASKFIALAGYILAGTFLGMIVAVISSAVITEIAGQGDYSFIDAGYVGESMLSYARTLLAIAPYVAMALFFSVWGRSTIAGIGASLGILFMETIITSLLRLSSETTARMTNIFPGANADTLMLENGLQSALRVQQTRPIDVPTLDPPLAALVLFGYFAAFAVATVVLFGQRDVRA